MEFRQRANNALSKLVRFATLPGYFEMSLQPCEVISSPLLVGSSNCAFDGLNWRGGVVEDSTNPTMLVGLRAAAAADGAGARRASPGWAVKM